MFAVRRSPAVWRGMKGVNLGWAYAYPTTPADPVGYAATVLQGFNTQNPPETLAGIRAAGFDFVRLIFDFKALVAAQEKELPARLAAYIDDTRQVIDTLVAAGLRVLLDFHISPSDPTYGNPKLLAGLSTSAAKFQALVAVQRAVARMLLRYSPEAVAIELLNEPPDEGTLAGVNAAWSGTLCRALFDAVRAENPKITIVVSGTDLGSIGALVGAGVDPNTSLVGLNPAHFDRNTLFSIHFYDPLYLTHGGYPSFAVLKYLDGISFPVHIDGVVDATARDAAIATATTNVNADTALSSADKTTAINTITSTLNNMYANQSVGWATNVINGRLRLAARWADANGIDRSRIFCGEFGVFRGTRGVTQAGKDAWLGMVRRALEAQDHRWAAFIWRDPFAGTAGFFVSPDNVSITPSTKAALGLG